MSFRAPPDVRNPNRYAGAVLIYRVKFRVEKFSVVLLAGGQSSRMGQDKGLAAFRGRPMVGVILEQIKKLGDEIIIISNLPAQYRQFGFPVFEDFYKGIGALGGLFSAIYYAHHELSLVLACDMPFVNLKLISAIVGLAPGYDAVVPRLGNEKWIEPFRAVYRRSCLEPIKVAIEAGERRAISFLESVRVRYFERGEIEKYDPGARSFFNINTPQDLIEAEQMADAFFLEQGYSAED